MKDFADPLTLAQALIRRASVTPADDGAIGLLEETLTRLGFACRRLSFGADAGRPVIENLYARRVGRGPNICFAGHTDVVPPGQGWTVEPFAAEVRDGRLFGRGAADMKGAIACFIAAIARLDAEAPEAPPALSLLITGDEEGRALDGTKRVLDWLAAEGETLDYCIVGEPTNPHRLGEMMKIGRRGSLNGRLRVLGAQGHVAYPDLADNPIPPLLAMLQTLTAAPLDQGSQHFQPSRLVLTSIDVGNPATNVIPAEARAAFNIRFNDLHSGQSLEKWLRGRLAEQGQAFELEVDVSGESFLTPPGPLSDALAAAIEAECRIRPEFSTSGGTSDARFIKSACPVVEFGLVGESMHKADENVRTADLESLTRIYLAAIKRLGSS